MKKLLKWLVIVVVLGVAGAVLARNYIARKSVEVGVKQVTGFPLEIGAVNVGLFNGQLDVQSLRLMNPSEFHDTLFVELPGFHVDYQLTSMLSSEPHINEMNIDLKEVVVVKRENGESNVQRLRAVGASSGGSAPDAKASGSSTSERKFRLDLVRLHIGTVRMIDYSRGQRTEREMKLNYTGTFRNIRSMADVTRLALMTILSQAHIPDVGIKMEDLQKNLGNVEGVANETIKNATNIGKGLFDKVKQAVPKKE